MQVLRSYWPALPAGKAVLIIAVAMVAGGCSQSARIGEPLTTEDRFAGDATEARMAFWHSLTERTIVSNEEAFHALRLFFEGKATAFEYPDQVERLKDRGWLPASFDAPPDAAIRRGVLAKALTEALNIEGGVMMRLVGSNPRYATRELQYLGIYPTSSSQQVFSGADFVGLMARVEDYQRKHAPEQAQKVARIQQRTAHKAQRLADRRTAAMQAALAMVSDSGRGHDASGASADRNAVAGPGSGRAGFVTTAAFAAPNPSAVPRGSRMLAQAEQQDQQQDAGAQQNDEDASNDGNAENADGQSGGADEQANGGQDADATDADGDDQNQPDGDGDQPQADADEDQQAAEGRQRVVVVTDIQGLVQARRDEDADWQPVEPGMKLGLGAELRTGPRSAVRFTIGETQTLTVDRLGTVRILNAIERDDEVRTDVGMKYGRSSLEVEAGGVEHESTIRSPSARLSVRGSKGALWQDAGGSSRVIASGHNGNVAWRNTDGQWIPLPPGSDHDNGDSSSTDNAKEDNNNDEIKLARTLKEHELRGDHPNGFYDKRRLGLDSFRGHDSFRKQLENFQPVAMGEMSVFGSFSPTGSPETPMADVNMSLVDPAGNTISATMSDPNGYLQHSGDQDIPSDFGTDAFESISDTGGDFDGIFLLGSYTAIVENFGPDDVDGTITVDYETGDASQLISELESSFNSLSGTEPEPGVHEFEFEVIDNTETVVFD